MRLIDADALVEQMEAEAEYIEDSICKFVVEMDIREVKRSPTVDAVPVVRCAECRHMDDSYHADGFDGMCRYWKYHSTDYSWFCSNGERRNE